LGQSGLVDVGSASVTCGTSRIVPDTGAGQGRRAAMVTMCPSSVFTCHTSRSDRTSFRLGTRKRHAEGLALDVPQRYLDSADRGHLYRTASYAEVVVQGMPVLLDLHGVLPDYHLSGTIVRQHWTLQVSVDQVLQHLLSSGLGLGVDAIVQHTIGQRLQRHAVREYLLAQVSIPSPVALVYRRP